MKIIVRLVEAQNGYYMEAGVQEREGEMTKFDISRIAKSAPACGRHIASLLTELRLKDQIKKAGL